MDDNHSTPLDGLPPQVQAAFLANASFQGIMSPDLAGVRMADGNPIYSNRPRQLRMPEATAYTASLDCIRRYVSTTPEPAAWTATTPGRPGHYLFLSDRGTMHFATVQDVAGGSVVDIQGWPIDEYPQGAWHPISRPPNVAVVRGPADETDDGGPFHATE